MYADISRGFNVSRNLNDMNFFILQLYNKLTLQRTKTHYLRVREDEHTRASISNTWVRLEGAWETQERPTGAISDLRYVHTAPQCLFTERNYIPNCVIIIIYTLLKHYIYPPRAHIINWWKPSGIRFCTDQQPVTDTDSLFQASFTFKNPHCPDNRASMGIIATLVLPNDILLLCRF